jgi:putative DNA primase/helicase
MSTSEDYELRKFMEKNPSAVKQLNASAALKKKFQNARPNGGDGEALSEPSPVTEVEAADHMLADSSAMPEPPPYVQTAPPVAEAWPEPEPLGGELSPVPPFDLEMLPEALRPLTEDTSERMQVPPEAPAVVTLVALGAATGHRAYIQPKHRDSTWKVFPNVWGALVMPSGFMKTPTMAAILAPIRETEKRWREEHKFAMAGYERQKELAEIRLAAWREESKRAYKKHKPEPPRPDDPPDEPVCRRLITNDASKEKAHVILAQNPGGMLFFRDELTGFFSQLDDLGHGGDRHFFMEMWNGYRYTIDRIGRGTIDADGCLSMLGGMTPRSLRLYVADANKAGRLDDGLLQRFQLSVYPDQQDWKHVDRVPNHDAMAQAKATYERLLALDPEQPLRFCFEEESLQLAIEWQTELEAKVRDGTLHPALVSHLSKYRSLMPSLALLFELADNGSQTTVSLAHARQAAAWCSFLEPHARRIYAPVISSLRQAAAELGRHLAAGWKREEGRFTVREIYRSDWRGLDSPEIVREALEILSDANWVRPVVSKTNGRPSEVYAINPRLKEVRPCPANG